MIIDLGSWHHSASCNIHFCITYMPQWCHRVRYNILTLTSMFLTNMQLQVTKQLLVTAVLHQQPEQHWALQAAQKDKSELEPANSVLSVNNVVIPGFYMCHTHLIATYVSQEIPAIRPSQWALKQLIWCDFMTSEQGVQTRMPLTSRK